MKVIKNTKHIDNKSVSLIYSLWPSDGEAKSILKEWENGEGYDLYLGDTHIELTHCELMAIVALAGIFQARLDT
jgi:hypothetical protein